MKDHIKMTIIAAAQERYLQLPEGVGVKKDKVCIIQFVSGAGVDWKFLQRETLWLRNPGTTTT